MDTATETAPPAPTPYIKFKKFELVYTGEQLRKLVRFYLRNRSISPDAVQLRTLQYLYREKVFPDIEMSLFMRMVGGLIENVAWVLQVRDSPALQSLREQALHLAEEYEADEEARKIKASETTLPTR